MSVRFKTKSNETMSFSVITTARDIEEGKCGLVGRCMEKVAIERALRKIDPGGGDHRVKIDAGDLRFTFRGFKWRAPAPRIAKRALIQFDKERRARMRAEKSGLPFKSKVEPHKYRVIDAVKGEPVQKFTRERQEQINAARRKRKEEGRPDKQKYDLRYRVEGLGSV